MYFFLLVLDCSTTKIYEILKQAQQIGLMTDYHSYLIPNLDLHTIDLSDFKYGGTNITGFRLINPKLTNDLIAEWANNSDLNLSSINVQTALIYDAVHLFAKALNDLDTSQKIDIQPLSCDNFDTWPHGFSLINYMKIIEMKGLTNTLKFDNQGFRTDFILDIIELSITGIRKIGFWNSTKANGVNFTRTFNEKQQEIEANLRNKTLIVTTILVIHFINTLYTIFIIIFHF